MILGIPAIDGHELTKALLDSLELTVTGDNFKVVIIDNASKKPYQPITGYSFPISILYLSKNNGYYSPLEFLYEMHKDELVGLIHNDMVLYARGWNERMERRIKEDGQLALVGLCGSSEIDERGGRGGGDCLLL